MRTDAVTSAIVAVEDVFGGYQPGFKLVEGSVPDAVEQFVVLRINGMPRLLLPPSNRAMRVALTQFIGARPWIGLALQIAQFTAKQRLFSRWTSEMSLQSQTVEPSKLRVLLNSVLGREDFYLALRLSFGRPNAKTVALAISHDGDALCFAKFGSEAMTNELVAHEGKILEWLASTDVPFLTPRVLYGGVWEEGRHVLITEPLQIEPLPDDAHIAHIAADSFTAANSIVTCALRDSEYWHRMTERVNKVEESRQQGGTLHTALSKIEKVWGSSVIDFGACHGDWSRANLGLVDGRVAAFDWERSSKLSPRGIDIAHFAMSEFTGRRSKQNLDVERVADKTRSYLNAASRPLDQAELLVILECLEMSVRFLNALKAGVQSDDSKFGRALQQGLQSWAS